VLLNVGLLKFRQAYDGVGLVCLRNSTANCAKANVPLYSVEAQTVADVQVRRPTSNLDSARIFFRLPSSWLRLMISAWSSNPPATTSSDALQPRTRS
jgi:hypothetical protein